MKHQIFRLPVVIKKTGLSRSTIYARIKEGTFPKPIQIGLRSVGWLEQDVELWFEQCINGLKK